MSLHKNIHFSTLALLWANCFALAGCAEVSIESEGNDGPAGKVESAIVGGADVSEDTTGTPKLNIARDDGKTGMGTGALLRPQWIVTARHVVEHADSKQAYSPEKITALLKDGSSAQADAVWFHPNSDLDVALVHFKTTLRTGTGRTFSNRIYNGSTTGKSGELFVQGWGGYSITGCTEDQKLPTGPSGELRWGTVAWGSGADPQSDLNHFAVLPDGMTGTIGAPGDSGSTAWLSTAAGTRATGPFDWVEGVCAPTPQWTKGRYVRPEAYRGWAEGVIGTAPALGSPAGFERSDGASSVVYRDSSNRVREICLGGPCGSTWHIGDLTGPEKASSNVATYVRADGTTTVVYRGENNHIYEIRRDGNVWLSSDLTAMTGAPDALSGSNPAAFVTAESNSMVLYRSADYHIRTLTLGRQGGWSKGDLSDTTGAPVAGSDPVGYVRADGVNAVVYRSNDDNHVREIAATAYGNWQASDLSALTGAGACAGVPRPYSRATGISQIVYRGKNGQLSQISLKASGGNWTASELGVATLGDPAPFVGFDGTSYILYVTKDANNIRQVYAFSASPTSNPVTLQLTNLTTSDSAPNNASLSGYVRADSSNAVVYKGTDGHVYELVKTGVNTWNRSDMNVLAGF